MTKLTSYPKAKLISLFPSSSVSILKVIIAEYVFILADSSTSVSGVGASIIEFVSDSTAENKSSESKTTENGFWKDSSDGRTKSPGKTEAGSAPPIILPLDSTSALCQSRGLTPGLVEPA